MDGSFFSNINESVHPLAAERIAAAAKKGKVGQYATYPCYRFFLVMKASGLGILCMSVKTIRDREDIEGSL